MYISIPHVSDVCSSSDVVLLKLHGVQVPFPVVGLNVLIGHGLQVEPLNHLPAGQTVTCRDKAK